MALKRLGRYLVDQASVKMSAPYQDAVNTLAVREDRLCRVQEDPKVHKWRRGDDGQPYD